MNIVEQIVKAAQEDLNIKKSNIIKGNFIILFNLCINKYL